MIEDDADLPLMELPRATWWRLLLWSAESRRDQLEHWVLTHVFRLDSCSSCGGYFYRGSGGKVPELGGYRCDQCEAWATGSTA